LLSSAAGAAAASSSSAAAIGANESYAFSGVCSLRHCGLELFIPWRVGAEESGAAKFGFLDT
jgi:hypothetical protein